jgi:fructose-bisphosphate aldolase, class I
MPAKPERGVHRPHRFVPPGRGCRLAGADLRSVLMNSLGLCAGALVAPGKGILAADESVKTASARLAAAGAATTGGHRRAYRELLVTTPGLASGVSGMILCEETLRSRLSTGETFPAALHDRGMLAGIKVDTGTVPLPGAHGETVTEGLDGLPARLRGYAALGARFAKWRAVLRIGPGTPSPFAIRANAQALARYAAACQEAGLVPVVEPEVLAEGSHSMGACEAVTSLVLLQVMSELHEYGIDFEGVVVKPNMALPGLDSGALVSPGEVAEATLGALNSLPATLAGVAFLSGGQRPEQATANLAALQRLPHVWPLTFSFGRALAGPALAAWHGDPGCWDAGQRALAHRVAMNVAALEGRYAPELELDLDAA